MWLPSTIGGGYFICCTVRDTQNMYHYVWYNKVEKKRVTPKHMDVFYRWVSLLQLPHSHLVAQRQSINSKVLTWENTGNNKCQHVPGHHYQLWPLLDHRRWGRSSKRKPNRGVPVKELQSMYPKSQVGDLHHNGTAHIGVCLGCLVSKQAQSHPFTGKSTMTSSQVNHQQLHGPVTRQCYINNQKSAVVKPWTTKMTGSPGDALPNQQWPRRPFLDVCVCALQTQRYSILCFTIYVYLCSCIILRVILLVSFMQS